VNKTSAVSNNKMADKITAVHTAPCGKNRTSNNHIKEKPKERPNPSSEYLII
jgi:hypothetical protein